MTHYQYTIIKGKKSNKYRVQRNDPEYKEYAFSHFFVSPPTSDRLKYFEYVVHDTQSALAILQGSIPIKIYTEQGFLDTTEEKVKEENDNDW